MAKAKKLPSGNWRVLLYTGKDENGKKHKDKETALFPERFFCAVFIGYSGNIHKYFQHFCASIRNEKGYPKALDN